MIDTVDVGRRRRGARRCTRSRSRSTRLSARLGPSATRVRGTARATTATTSPARPIVGEASPLSPRLDWEIVTRADGTPGVEARGTFGAAYEGPPSFVHGGWIACAFDEVLGIANIVGRQPGHDRPPRSCTTASPRRCSASCGVRAWVDRVEGRRIMSRAEMYDGDTLTAEAEGLFVQPRPELAAEYFGRSIAHSVPRLRHAPHSSLGFAWRLARPHGRARSSRTGKRRLKFAAAAAPMIRAGESGVSGASPWSVRPAGIQSRPNGRCAGAAARPCTARPRMPGSPIPPTMQRPSPPAQGCPGRPDRRKERPSRDPTSPLAALATAARNGPARPRPAAPAGTRQPGPAAPLPAPARGAALRTRARIARPAPLATHPRARRGRHRARDERRRGVAGAVPLRRLDVVDLGARRAGGGRDRSAAHSRRRRRGRSGRRTIRSPASRPRTLSNFSYAVPVVAATTNARPGAVSMRVNNASEITLATPADADRCVFARDAADHDGNAVRHRRHPHLPGERGAGRGMDVTMSACPGVRQRRAAALADVPIVRRPADGAARAGRRHRHARADRSVGRGTVLRTGGLPRAGDRRGAVVVRVRARAPRPTRRVPASASGPRSAAW